MNPNSPFTLLEKSIKLASSPIDCYTPIPVASQTVNSSVNDISWLQKVRPISSRGKGRPVGSSSPRITAKSKTTRPHSCDSPQVSISKTETSSGTTRNSKWESLNICLAPRSSWHVAGQPATQPTTGGRWWTRWASLGERARWTFKLGDRDALTLNQHHALMLFEEQY